MTTTIAGLLLVGAGIGVALSLLQLVLVAVARRRRPRVPAAPLPSISILKPLCGLDDELRENLESFLALRYPDFEVLLGVADVRDAAYPVACDLARRAPDRVRVVVQHGAPGLNPKINQLITLERAARHELLVVSDSNIRVPTDYLHDIAAALADPAVGMTTHAIVGAGGCDLGARLDNLHLSTLIGPAIAATDVLPTPTLVVGKSMALRRATLRRIGGFRAFASLLAEDYAMGRAIQRGLGLRVTAGAVRVENITTRRSVAQFYDRYRRWAVMHRQAIGTPAYVAELLLLPMMLALLAIAVCPSVDVAAFASLIVTAKFTIDLMLIRVVAGRLASPHLLGDSFVKEAVLFGAWLYGLSHQHVVWRGKRLYVERGTRMRPIAHEVTA